MDLKDPGLSLSDYTFLYQWNRTLTDLDLKRRKADKREKERMQIPYIEKIANPTLGFEVENFKTFGSLRRTVTEIHNTVPSFDTVAAEKECIHFEDQRRRQPHAVKYNKFYGTMHNEVNKPRTPKTPSSIAISGIEEERTSTRIQHKSDGANHRSRDCVNSRNGRNESAYSLNGSERKSEFVSPADNNHLDLRTPVP